MFDYEILYFVCSFVDFDFVWCVLGEIDDVAYFYIYWASAAVFKDFSCSDGNDFSFVRFFFAVGENDSAFCGGFLYERFN
jgi:hypothetical protein